MFRIKESDEEKEKEEHKENKKENEKSGGLTKKNLEKILTENQLHLFSPRLRGVSPKYFHHFSNKIVDSRQRIARLSKNIYFY